MLTVRGSGPRADAGQGHQQAPVAVVGLGAIMPGAVDVRGFWRNAVDGRDLITDVPPDHWLVEDYYSPEPGTPGKTYVRRGAFLPPVDFDPLWHRVPPRDVPMTDTAQLLGLVVAEQVLADLAGGLAGLDRERVSVILGASSLELLSTVACRVQYPLWRKALREQGLPESRVRAAVDAISAQYAPGTEATFPGLLTNVVAGRIANRFDLHGANHTTDAACASSLAAVHGAVAELALGRADLVLTGGVDAANGIDTFMCFTETPALSPTEDCRPFSAGADGTMLGEGLAMFALKRLADAERAGDRVYAVLRGLGASSDGGGTAIYAPVPQGQARALRRAYRQAGYGPGTVELVEAHGTGTAAGDRAEFRALREVFDDGDRDDRRWCALGSVKSQIGHTKAAAGAAGLLKAVLAVHHGVLPPTIKVDRPNPELDFAGSPFYLNTAARPWVRGPDHPRRAAVSSFGFGGSNFHLTLEEHAPSGAGRLRTAPTELVLLGADSAEELLARIDGLDTGRAPADLARDAARAFSAARSHRLAVVAGDADGLRAELARAARSVRQRPGAPFATPAGTCYAAGPARTGRVAFLFPGQGSQHVGMGADLAMHEPRALAAWDRHATADLGDGPLHRVVFPPPAFTDEERAAQRDLLTRTEWAQPALAVHALALLEVLAAVGLRPDCAAGHSFGELTALHCAGVLTAADLVALARERGEAVAAAAVPGAMVAVAAGRAEVAAALARCDEPRVWIANDNGPAQVVLSGAVDAVGAVARRLRADGHDVVGLAAATAFHSPLVAGAVGPLRAFLDRVDVAPPRIPVYGNADAAPYPGDPGAVRGRIAEQVVSPVRFADTVEAMYADGVRTFVEVGARTTLCGLTGAVLAGRDHLVVGLQRPRHNGMTELHRGLARLAAAGVELDLAALWEPYARTAPERKQGMTVQINGANHGKPYPPAGGASALPPPNPEPPAAAPPVVVAGAPDEGAGPPVRAAAGAVDAGLLRLFAEAQRETARAHEEYQRSLTESHLAFLRMSEASFAMLLGVEGARSGGVAADRPAPTPVGAPAAAPAGPPAVPVDVPAAEPLPPPAVVVAPTPMPEPAPAPLIPVERVERAEPVVRVEPVVREEPAARAGTDARAVERELLSVVADRTGYPEDMVRLDMALDEDLGIDSIKRVEIFSALRQRIGDGVAGASPIGELTELSKLRTLREVADRIGGRDAHPGAAAGEPDPPPARGTGEPPPPPPGAGPFPPPPERVDPEPLPPPAARTASGTPPTADEPPSAVDAEPFSPPGADIGPEPLPPPAARVGGRPLPPPLTRLALRAVAEPAPGVPVPGLGDGPVAVVGGPAAVAGLVARGLAEHGVPAEVTDRPPPAARGLVLLGGLGEAGPEPAAASPAARAADVALEAFRAVRSVAARFRADGGLLVAVQDTGGDFGLGGRPAGRAWFGGFGALARTAAAEWPRASVKAVDCEQCGRDPQAVADAVVRELLGGGAEPDVGLRADGSRLVPRWDPAPPAAVGAARVDPGSVLVVTGGARGMTARALLDLARARRPRLLVLGRTALDAEPDGLPATADEAALVRALAAREPGRPPLALTAEARRVLAVREVRAALDALRQAGAQVRYSAVDVRDATAVAAVIAEVRAEWGPITGIVHGAGALADSAIADQTDERFRQVFDTKVAGLHALLAATADDPLRLLCLFSSVVGCFGNAGQADYAMANAVLDRVASAERARRPDCLVRSIAWGPWDGGMVTPAHADRFRSTGLALIRPDDGAEAFTAELDGPAEDARVLVAAGDPRPAFGPVGPREVRVDPRTHPQLADHVLAGVPVLPVAVVLDWFAAAAREGEAQRLVLRDLRVLRKVALPGGHGRLFLHTAADPGGPLVELRAADGVLHYRARPGDPRDAAPGTGWAPPADLQALGRDVYDGHVLFHGPRFQSLVAVDGVSAAGAAGAVVGAAKLGWEAGDWLVDPAAADGGLQLACLWAERVLGGRCLPMAVGETRVHRPGPLAGVGRCVLLARRVHHSDALCDVALLDDGGVPVLEMLDVDLVLCVDED